MDRSAPSPVPPSVNNRVCISLETMCLFKKLTSGMDSTSFPLILFLAAPVLKNHCFEGGGRDTKHRKGKGRVCELFVSGLSSCAQMHVGQLI